MSTPEDLIPETLLINGGDSSIEYDRQSSLSADDTTGPDETTSLLSFRREFFESSYNNCRQFYNSTANSINNDSLRLESTSSSSSSILQSIILNIPNTQSRRSSARRGSAISDVTSNNVAMHYSMLHNFAEDMDADNTSNLSSTILSILPLLQGTPIFVIPYAFITGGLWFIPLSIILCIIADVSSKLLIECLYTYSTRGDVKSRTYNGIHGIACSCLGVFGGNVVYSLVIFNLISNNIINVVVFDICFRDLFRSSHTLDPRVTSTIYVIVFTSMMFTKKVSTLVVTGFLGSLCLAVASATAMITFLCHTKLWPMNLNSIPLGNISHFPLAASMFMCTLLANPILPEIEAGMITPYKVDSALHISYGISTVFKVLFGLFGILSYSLQTCEFIAINIGEHSKVARYFISISIMLCTTSNFSIPYHALFDKLDLFVEYRISVNCREGKRMYIVWFLFSRTLGVIFTVLVANKLQYYASVAAVVGSVSGTTLILVLPAMFHLRLHWDVLNGGRRNCEILFIIFGVVFGSMCIYESCKHLFKQIV